MICSHGTSNTRGVVILFRRNLAVTIERIYKDNDGRILIVECVFQGTKFVLTNIYAPNNDDPEFFITTAKRIEEFENTNIIWGGDFNLVMNPAVDRMGSDYNHTRAFKVLETYLQEADMLDVWRVKNPDLKMFTWHRDKTMASASRIDMFLVSAGMINYVQHTQIVPGFRSDHSMITLNLKFSEDTPRGRGVWKLNTSLLKDKDYVESINQEINNVVVDHRQRSPDYVWEQIKNAAINVSIGYSITKAKAKKQKFNELYGRIEELNIKLHNCNNTVLHQVSQDLESAKADLELMSQEKVKSIIFRSKAKYYSEGERSSKYFFALEKSNFNKKVMKALKQKDGTITREHKYIMLEQARFYRKLYKSNPQVRFTLTNNTDISLTQEQSEDMDQPITLEELSCSLMAMPNGKTPGMDELGCEFYKVFWRKLGPIYLRMIQYSLEQGRLNSSARNGIIQLIPKRDRDTLFLENWRPLTLLNTDYKIFSKALANRLKRVLPSLIDSDQTGFMKGRDISSNIRKVIDVIEYTKRHQIPAAILSIDWHKCFDKIENQAISGALEYFGFGQRFCHYTKVLLTDFLVRVQNNGYVSEPIKVERSVRQGCCAAPFYYLLTGQIFSNLIKNNPDIKGITIREVRELVSQFADDTDLFLAYDQLTFQTVEKVFSIVETNMGLAINYDKTVVYCIGSLCNSEAKLYTIKPLAWTNDPISVLGVTITNDLALLGVLNYADILNRVQTICNMWGNRMLSLSGKVLVVNTLIASLFVYKMSVLPNLPKIFIQQFNAIIHKFLWEGKRAKITTRILVTPRECGGLKLVDLELRQYALKSSMALQEQRATFF